MVRYHGMQWPECGVAQWRLGGGILQSGVIDEVAQRWPSLWLMLGVIKTYMQCAGSWGEGKKANTKRLERRK